MRESDDEDNIGGVCLVFYLNFYSNMQMGRQATFIKALSLHWIVGQSNGLDISFCLYWWDFSFCYLIVENPFAPLHNSSFPPPNAPMVPVPETWLAVTGLGVITSSLGVDSLAHSSS